MADAPQESDIDGVQQERTLRLKQSRGGFKSALTKKRNELRALMKDSKNIENVKVGLHELNETIFRNFADAHQLYHDSLVDEDEIEESFRYYDRETEIVRELNYKISSWINSFEVHDDIRPSDSVSQIGVDTHSNKRFFGTSVISTSSSVKQKLIEETAKRKALENRMHLLREEQELNERSFQLQKRLEEEKLRLKQQGQMYKVKAKLAEATAKEEVYSQAEEEEYDDKEDVFETHFSSEANPWASQPKVNVCNKVISHSSQAPSDETKERMIDVQEIQMKCMEKLVQQQHESILALTLPKPEVPVFDGNPMEYCNFIRAFESLIEAKTTSNSSRLFYLIQYTMGEVRELMRSCLSMEPKKGYETARSLLKKRFGQNYKIATAYIDQVSNGPPIKSEDGKGLQKFSVLLTSCVNTLKEIGYISRLENPESLRGIIARLPYDLRKRWRVKADFISEEEGREITLTDVAQFVEKMARSVTHPIFGDISDKDKKKTISHTKPKGINFAAQLSTETKNKEVIPNRVANTSSKVCPLCNGDHNLSECSEFKGKSYEERLKIVRSKGLCFNCFIPYHKASECRKKAACKDCGRRHSSLLHSPTATQRKQSSNDGSSTPCQSNSIQVSDSDNLESVCGLTGTVGSTIGLPIVPVKVKVQGHNRFIITHALLDSGSNSTFCTDELASKLNVKGRETSLSLTTIDRQDNKTKSSIVSLEVYDLEERNIVELNTVFTWPNLPFSVEDIPKQEDVNRWAHLQGIQIPKVNTEVGLLIGNDNVKALEPIEIKRSDGKGPYAVRTILGWSVNGPLGRESTSIRSKVNFIRSDAQLSQQFERFCNQEFNDSIIDIKAEMSQEDQRAISIMNETVKLKDNHYELALPWRELPPCLPNNKPLAEHRLRLLKKRFQKDPDLYERYYKFMNELLTLGYAEKVPDEVHDREDGMVWYLPHHPVFNPNKPDKTRVVFDCSAKYRGVSLNDQLLQGPNLTNSLIGVLTRFRQEVIAVMADIESMFHQVRVTPEHCDVLRFLWWAGKDLNKEPEEYRMRVHLFGGISSPSCANFGLLRTARDNEEDFDPETVNTVKRNFYVDDCLKSIKNEDSAVKLVDELRNLLSKGGFRLTKWVSNSKKCLESIPESERATSVKTLDLEHLPVERALGMMWYMESDKFGFKVTIKDRPSTRRGILSVMSSVFDPIGFASPVVLPAKAILQDLCKKGHGWDDAIPESSLEQWNRWKADLKKLETLSLSRCVKPFDFGEVVCAQLHHFSDASLVGYGAVSYLRLIDSAGRIHCAFLLGKSRLVPLKPITVPRLELSAATVSVKLDKILKIELDVPIQCSTFWTDSMSVLRYVNNKDKRFHTFVANRIAMIHDGSVPSQWMYVETKKNPADDASRGMSVSMFLKSSRWLLGPDFLWCNEDEWPKQLDLIGDVPATDEEVKKEVKICNTILSNSSGTLDKIIERFSSWFKLKKCIAWILRYKNRLREACKTKDVISKEIKKSSIEPISVDELNSAEESILKYIQRRYFAEEIAALQEGAKSVKGTSKISSLDPQLVDGLLRVGGRLKRASIPEDSKHQVILPKSQHVTTLIIRHFHSICGHSGREYVLSLLRGKFWVIKANSAVRKVLRTCINCRKRQAPANTQKMADLPRERVEADSPPFSSVGIDCFGPLYVRCGRSQVKRYGCLFTCLAVRAIHIEVTQSLDTDSFLNAMRRFIARRGKPVKIRSDNGGNFVSGNQELKKSIAQWNHKKIQDFLLQQDIQWNFNPPTASHMGGSWERCIRTVRKIMCALLKEQTLNDEALTTLMCEIESIVNGRPITRVSEDHRDMEALTPNHLLLLRSCSSFPPGVFVKQDVYCRRRWRQVQFLADQFWKRWVKEYLPQLQQRQKWRQASRNISVGDIVLIVDNTSPRGSWPMARVLEVKKSDADGLVRAVKLKTQTSILERPVHKCVFLEGDES